MKLISLTRFTRHDCSPFNAISNASLECEEARTRASYINYIIFKSLLLVQSSSYKSHDNTDESRHRGVSNDIYKRARYTFPAWPIVDDEKVSTNVSQLFTLF